MGSPNGAISVILIGPSDYRLEGSLEFSEIGLRVFNSVSEFSIPYGDIETITPLPNRRCCHVPDAWHTLSIHTKSSQRYELATKSFSWLKRICGLITCAFLTASRKPLTESDKSSLSKCSSGSVSNSPNFFSAGLCRISDANANYSVCETYPRYLIVPSSITDDVLGNLAKFRRGGRFPLVTYFHRCKATLLAISAEIVSTPRNGVKQSNQSEFNPFNHPYFAALTSGMKFSQLSSGISQNISQRCRADEKLLLALLSSSQRGTIVDIRCLPKQKKNNGMSDVDQQNPQWKPIKSPIADPIEINYAFKDFIYEYTRILKPTCATSDLSEKYEKPIKVSLKKSTCWLKIVCDTLNASIHGARALDGLDSAAQNQLKQELRKQPTNLEPSLSVPTLQGSCVLILGNEGRDRTLVVASLVQIILSPEVRTIQGFRELIQRVWLSGGHAFTDRYLSSDSDSASPIFILFLDCVWQIFCQYPSSFEFSEDLLTLLAEHVYKPQFDTLSGNCDHERESSQRCSNSDSLWRFVNSPSMIPFFTNPLYSPSSNGSELTYACWPSTSPQALDIWREVYQMKFGSDCCTLVPLSRFVLLKAHSDYMERKKSVQELQGILRNLQDEAIRANILRTEL